MASHWTERIAYFRGGLTWAPEPVFHRTRLWDDREENGDIITIRAICGVALSKWNRQTGAHHIDPTVIRRDNAEKFGRPCRRGCWKADA